MNVSKVTEIKYPGTVSSQALHGPLNLNDINMNREDIKRSIDF